MRRELGCFNLVDSSFEQPGKVRALLSRDRCFKVLDLRLMFPHENYERDLRNTGCPGIANQLRVERQESSGAVGITARRDPGIWRSDAISLEYQLWSPAGRADAFRGDRNDLREADEVRFVHSQGYGFNFTFVSNSDEVVDYHGCYCRRSGSDHNQFAALGASSGSFI